MQQKLPFTMPAPNEDCNEEDVPLSGVRHTSSFPPFEVKPGVLHRPQGLPITADIFFKPTPQEPYSLYDAWDGYLMAELFRASIPVADALDELWLQDWSHAGRKRVTGALQKVFHSQYFAACDARILAIKETFHNLYPDYQGVTPGFEVQVKSEKMIALRSFEAALPLVVLWAMCNFSRYRQYWAKGEVATKAWPPLNISSQPTLPQDQPAPRRSKGLLQDGLHTAKQRAEQQRKEKLAAMTEQQRREFLAREALLQEVMRLHRQGKVDEQMLIDLEIIEPQ